MRLDLHCHSTYSDGFYSAAVLAQKASEQEIQVFALTDHDTCEGNQEIETGHRGISVRAAEITAIYKGKTVHLLAYDAERNERWQTLVNGLKEVALARRHRALDIVEKLKSLGCTVDEEKLFETTTVIGRPHIAQALVRSGDVRSKREAFDKYLFDGGPADVPLSALKIMDVLHMVSNAGGVVALAHPHTVAAEEIVAEFVPNGLGGIEAYYATYQAKTKRRWLKLARAHNLVPVGGSDFHGSEKEAPNLGIDYPEEHVDSLKRWLRI